MHIDLSNLEEDQPILLWAVKHKGEEFGAWSVVAQDSDGSQDGANLIANYHAFMGIVDLRHSPDGSTLEKPQTNDKTDAETTSHQSEVQP